MKKYINYLNKNQYSINTINTYKSVLSIYKPYMKDIRLIKKEIAKRFKSPNTAWLHYNVICSYFKWMKDKRLETLKMLKLPAIPVKYMPIFTKDFLLKRTKIIDDDDYSTIFKKNIIRFLFETGLRASELHKIITIKKDTIVVLGKGNKTREVFFKTKISNEIKNFPFTTKTLRIWVKTILGTEFTPHSIRRSHATHLLLKGADPKMVMLQMGHSKIETTFRYLQLSYSTNKKIYNKYF